jgi:hypothetical protein
MRSNDHGTSKVKVVIMSDRSTFSCKTLATERTYPIVLSEIHIILIIGFS